MSDRTEIDRWVISLLNTLIKDVEADYADYEPTRATRKIQAFVEDHLSNWYVRLCRRRFWKGDYSQDKKAAYQTLYTCLLTVSKLMAPVSPFFADWLYRNLNTATGQETHDSVHLSLYPATEENLIDKALEQRMNYAQRISSLVLSLRKKESLRVRQPLTKVLLPILDEKFQTQVEQVEDLIIAEVNVKEIEYISDSAGVIKKKIKPNFKTLGKTLGKNMKDASKLIGAFTQEDITSLEKNGSYNLSVNGESFDLDLSDFEISAEEIPGWQVAQDGDITVALDITLTDDLRAEGMARELVNRIQGIRRDTDLDVTDRINIKLRDHESIRNAVNQYGDYIKAEVLGEDLSVIEMTKGTEIELPGDVTLLVQIEKV